jgi:hypothetical protein
MFGMKLLAAAVVFGVTAQAGVIVFDFDGDTVGTTTTFTDTVNGLSATFSSPSDPGGFVIQPTIFQALNGNVLGDPGPAGANGIPLDISFSSPLAAISLVFATADFGTPSPFTLTTFNGGTQVGMTSSAGFVPPGFTFPEGEIAFEGAAFNRVELATTAPDFAIDQVATVGAPEPGAVWIAGMGLVALGCLRRRRGVRTFAAGAVAAAAMLAAPRFASAQNVLPLPAPSASTAGPLGDFNPYGVAYVPSAVPNDGLLQHGNILVSNFNDFNNLQGRGSTIVQITPQGQTLPFYTSQVSGERGFTAALGILSDGIVIAGYLPTVDGTAATLQTSGLVFLDRHGVRLGNLTAGIDGPWGMAINDHGTGSAQVFVSNVRNGTVVRVDLSYASNGESVNVLDTVTIAAGYANRVDPAALVVGPSGLALDAAHNILYVASQVDLAIYSLSSIASGSQGTGSIVYQDSVHLHGPLGVVLTPNGHLLIANSDATNIDPNQPSEIVEATTGGRFLGQYSIDPNAGGAFGVAVQYVGWNTLKVAAVNDNQSALRMWTTVLQ